MNPRQALSRLRTWFEDEVLTAPSASFSPGLWGCEERAVAAGVEQLHRDGYVSLGNIVAEPELAAIRSRIDAAAAGRTPEVNALWNAEIAYWRLTSPMRLHPSLVALAAHPMTLALAERYFMRPAYLSDVDMRRVLPYDTESIEKKRGYSSSNWHRDLRGRQVKVMIYLTDVGPQDSCFAFLPGTQAGQHSRNKNYKSTRYTDAEASALPRPKQDWLGSAGEAMLFDTNMLHRLSRRPGASVRDSITYYYTPGQALFGIDVDPADVARLPAASRHVFAEPGGLARTRNRASSDGADAA